MQLQGYSEYMCNFFSYKQLDGNVDGNIWIRIYNLTKDEFTNNIQSWMVTAPTADPALPATVGIDPTCEYSVTSRSGEIAYSNDYSCTNYPITDKSKFMTGQDNGTKFSAYMEHSKTFVSEDTTAMALMNAKLSMMKLFTGTWASYGTVDNFNWNYSGLSETADEEDTDTGAISIGSAAMFAAAVATVLAF